MADPSASRNNTLLRPVRPNLVFCAGWGSQVEPLRSALAAHPRVGFLGPEDFAEVDGTEQTFPLNTFEALYTSAAGCTDAFEAIARRLAGEVDCLGWRPGYAVEFPHVLWTVAEHLPRARLLFVLRDPVDSAHARYRAHRDRMPSSFAQACDACEREMARIGAFDNRNGWDTYFAEPSPLSLLLQAGVYEPAVRRCMRLFEPARLHAVAYETFCKEPRATLTRILEFLDLPDDPEVHRRVAGGQPGRGPADIEPPLRRRLEAFYAEFNERLFDLLGWTENPWAR